jgi:UDP-N-acetylmuramyl pentapeptide phosphotransferase/UDP-N-acetylglucosamine-1-phosphate transferase
MILGMTLGALLRHFAFAVGLALLSAVLVRLMIAFRVMDHPEARKMHDRPTPKGGGVGVVLSFLVGILLLYQYAAFARLADPYFRGVIEASAAIAIVAFLDDLYDWPFTVKLGAQVLAALVAVSSGLYVHDVRLPYVGIHALGWVGVVATLAWLLFTTNAMNFIDGLNGLAAGVAVIACLALAAIAALLGGPFVYFASLLLASGLIGFLPFNFPRARIFMGDVGSQFCGFVLAVLGVVAARFEQVELSALLVPLLLFGVLFDVAFTLLRRAAAGDRLTEAHRSHLYQVAHRAGMRAVSVTLVHWGFALWGALCCAVFLLASGPAKPLALLLVLPPQLLWMGYVIRRARRAGIGRW